MRKGINIRGWDRRHCDACHRQRVHYRLGLDKETWYCIGTLDAVSDVVAPHGKPRNAATETTGATK